MNTRHALAAVVLALLGGGCALLIDRPVPARYFLLTAKAERAAGMQPRSDLILGLGPIRLASYLDRPSLVTRLDANRVEPSTDDLWAAPLNPSLTSVLVENLMKLLGPRQVIVYPWYSTADVACQVRVDIRRLERLPNGGIAFEGQWSAEELGGNGRLRRGRTVVERTVSQDTEAQVGALSEALAQMSQEIAVAVDEVTRGKPSRPARRGEARGEVNVPR